MAQGIQRRNAEIRLCESFFDAHSVFTADEFRMCLTAQAPRACHPARLLQGYVAAGRLHRIKRDLYAPRCPALPANQEPVGSLAAVAARMTADAVLAYHTALECYGMAYSVWFYTVYAARKPKKNLRVAAGLIRGTTFPRALRAAGAEYVETTAQARHGWRLTTVERTLVDIVDRPDLSGGWDEVLHGYDAAPFMLSVAAPERRLDVTRMVNYAQSLGKSSTCAKVGFLLDLYRQEWQFDAAVLEPLLAQRPRQRRYWEPRALRLPAAWAPKWNLMAPCWIQRREWRRY